MKYPRSKSTLKFFMFVFTALSFLILVSACSNDTNEEIVTEELLVYLNNLDEETAELTFDEIEWIDESNTERIKELGLDPDSDFPSGFQVYNESEQTRILKLSNKAEIDIVNGANLQEPLKINSEELASLIPKNGAPFYITIENNIVIKISEKYTP